MEKIRTIAQQVYGAEDIELSPEAQAKIDEYTRQVRSCSVEKLPWNILIQASGNKTCRFTHSGIWRFTCLHGQNTPVTLSHAWEKGCAYRIHPAHQRRPCQHRGGVYLSSGWNGEYFSLSSPGSVLNHVLSVGGDVSSVGPDSCQQDLDTHVAWMRSGRGMLYDVEEVIAPIL